MSSIEVASTEDRRATTPRAGAVAGLLFAVLFSMSIVLIYLSAEDASSGGGGAMDDGAAWLKFGIGLMPFAGISFLWFIGVARDRLGRFEDQFFSTVFLGSGLLFLAMVFVASGVAGAVLVGYARDPAGFAASNSSAFARDIIMEIFTVYAMRMAAVFVLTQAALWLRTKVMPRWTALLSFAVGFMLLFFFPVSSWMVLAFPAWVFFVSLYILIASGSRRRAGLEKA